MTNNLERLPEDDAPVPGSRWLDRFEIISILGNGASGRVYKARHLLLDQFVAIKLIKTDLLESEIAVQRFRNEAALLSSFKQENIVGFHSFGTTAGGRHYMVLEFLEGSTLWQILQTEGSLSEQRAKPLFLDICKGLAYAHAQGVIHRDLKPGNVMVSQGLSGETAKILDFGIFKPLISDSQKLTKSGALPIGSVNYMSPEQCRGAALDLRSDIYSLGCLIYETLCGQAPMQDKNDLLIMSNHQNKQIKAVPSGHGISKDMEKIILKCLQKDPQERYASANELAEAIEQAKAVAIKQPSAKKTNLLAAALVILLVSAGYALFASQYSVHPPLSSSEQSIDIWRNRSCPNGDDEQALENIDAWLKANISVKGINPRMIGSAYTNACRLHKNLKPETKPPCGAEIEALFRQELDKQKTSHRSNFEDLLGQLANMQDNNGKFAAAFQTREQLLKSIGSTANESRRAALYRKLAVDAAAIGNIKDAIRCFQMQAAIDDKLGRGFDQSECLYLIAEAYLRSAEIENARASALKSNEVFRKALDEAGKAPLDKAARLAQDLNKLAEYKQVIALLEALKDKAQLTRSFTIEPFRLQRTLARAYDKSGQQQLSAEIEQSVLSNLEEAVPGQNRSEYKAALEEMIDFCAKNGKKEDAAKLEKKLAGLNTKPFPK